MKTDELKQIAEGLIETTEEAGKKSIESVSYTHLRAHETV